MTSKIPDNLFILEMANNHMGSVEHGLHLIGEFAKVCKDFPEFNFAFKMQYRQLDSFIHPDFKQRMDIKYVKRFSETRLSREQTRELVQGIKDNGFRLICTPFDNDSVDLIIEDGFDILKIASCSFTDWPLLDCIGERSLPVIASTAGVALKDIDNVVSYLKHRDKDFVLMHCMAEYPTLDENLQLGQIDFLQKRYPNQRIGFSTHEAPGSTVPVAMAIAKGVRVFEKHVAVPTEQHAINAYSCTPDQVRAWLTAARQAFAINGITAHRIEPTDKEQASLISLRRGVFAKRDIAVGERLHNEDVFMAIPTQDGHITANDWSKYTHYFATREIAKGQAITTHNSRSENIREKVYDIVQRVKGLLREGNIVVPGEADLEISHHYGMEKFEQFGITMLTVVNRDYCKKLIVVLPGQNHPEQYHNKKEETFHILHGQLKMILGGVARECVPGDVVTVEPGVRHEFESPTGAVFEEISSTHYIDDSFYTDPEIAKNSSRKTFITHWMG